MKRDFPTIWGNSGLEIVGRVGGDHLWLAACERLPPDVLVPQPVGVVVEPLAVRGNAEVLDLLGTDRFLASLGEWQSVSSGNWQGPNVGRSCEH
jgi:hypothetical protein